MKFRRYECGCIAIDDIVCIKPCDTEERLYEFYKRKFTNKSYTILSNEERDEIIKDLDKLIGDGYTFRMIKESFNR